MWPGYWGLLSDSGRKGLPVTIYGAGASIFDGVMGSVRDHGLSGIIRLTNFYFLRFSGLIVCTMPWRPYWDSCFPGPGGNSISSG